MAQCKVCPGCQAINILHAVSCSKCGRPFRTIFPGDPRTQAFAVDPGGVPYDIPMATPPVVPPDMRRVSFLKRMNGFELTAFWMAIVVGCLTAFGLVIQYYGLDNPNDEYAPYLVNARGPQPETGISGAAVQIEQFAREHHTGIADASGFLPCRDQWAQTVWFGPEGMGHRYCTTGFFLINNGVITSRELTDWNGNPVTLK